MKDAACLIVLQTMWPHLHIGRSLLRAARNIPATREMEKFMKRAKVALAVLIATLLLSFVCLIIVSTYFLLQIIGIR